MNVIVPGNSDSLVVKSWCADIEPGALEQAQHLALLPFAFHHVALMPDCHQGYGMPIGGVLATDICSHYEPVIPAEPREGREGAR